MSRFGQGELSDRHASAVESTKRATSSASQLVALMEERLGELGVRLPDDTDGKGGASRARESPPSPPKVLRLDASTDVAAVDVPCAPSGRSPAPSGEQDSPGSHQNRALTRQPEFGQSEIFKRALARTASARKSQGEGQG